MSKEMAFEGWSGKLRYFLRFLHVGAKVRIEEDEVMDVRRRGKTIAAMSAEAVEANGKSGNSWNGIIAAKSAADKTLSCVSSQRFGEYLCFLATK